MKDRNQSPSESDSIESTLSPRPIQFPNSHSRYCHCHECTELYLGNAPTIYGNGAKARGENIHMLIKKQVKTMNGINKISQILDGMSQ